MIHKVPIFRTKSFPFTVRVGALMVKMPRVITLSGGGNDIVGDELSVLLNHEFSSLPARLRPVPDGARGDRRAS